MLRTLLLASAAVLAAPAAAQDSAAADDFHVDQPKDIVVTAPFQRDRDEFLTGISVLSGADLAREVRPTIGETLARLPGVSATSFGPNASRPVLRGLQGERIRVLTDGIGSFDVSNTSVDHPVSINPFLAERVEVLRGPAALQFGSSAIGGVVNVIDRRIPRRRPDESFHADMLGGYASAADQWFGAGSVDVPVGKVVLHADGSYLDGGNVSAGDFVLSRRARAEAAASTNPDVQALAELRGRIPNSAARTWDIAGGASVITDDGSSLGFAVSRYDNKFGIPPRFDLTTGEGEAPTIDAKQLRLDARAEIKLGDGFFEMARGRFGFADYKHNEIEPDGEIGTTFLNEAMEGRIELVQAPRGAWKGAIGAQFFIRDFNAVGEEAFLPKNDTQQFGVFTLQQFNFGRATLEFGGRLESTDVNAPGLGLARDFTAVSGSAGASVELAPGWRLGVNASRTERAPSAEELYSNGPHAGTQAFEIGDPDLRKERNIGLEAVLRGNARGLTVEVSAYYNRFSRFIYEADTGLTDAAEGLPIFAYRQNRARFYGVEAQVSANVADIGGTRIGVDGVADYVRATLPGIGPVPRIPPLRLLGGVSATADRLTARVEVEHSFEQTRTASFETDTDAFTLVNASIGFRPFGTGPSKPELLVQANNIFDVDARRHASLLKDFAPLPGRDIRVTLRASF